jgi:hypothetical protein
VMNCLSLQRTRRTTSWKTAGKAKAPAMVRGSYTGRDGWLTIRRMKVREAKDFLVQETAKQASVEGVPLSELEKRMMYFTESGYVPEDPIALNEEFEAQHDTDEYEAKIAELLHHAYERSRKENDETRSRFDAAIKSLRRGDHYLLVMWDMGSGVSPLHLGPGFPRVYLMVLVVVALALGVFFAMRWVVHHFRPPNPRILQAIVVAVVLFGLFFQRATGKAFDWILENTFERFLGGDKPEE